jgi:hypothetical protein
MKESYIEGVAIHDDPESCAGSRKAEREVLTGARTGSASSREIRLSRAPTLSSIRECRTLLYRSASCALNHHRVSLVNKQSLIDAIRKIRWLSKRIG